VTVIWSVGRVVRNRRLAKAISGCGFGTIRTMLGYKNDPQPQGSNGRGADRKTRPRGPVAVKRPPGTAPPVRPGPSHRKAGLPIVRSLERTER